MNPGARPTRVLFVNSRPDAFENPGGDTIQVLQTRAALESLGITVEARGPQELSSVPACDLIHVFNLQMPENTANVFDALRPLGKPIVLSPIYWDTEAYWFEAATEGRARWRWPARVVGKERTRRAYVAWQRFKAPANLQWKTQRRLLEEARRLLPNSQAEAVLLRETFGLDNGSAAKCDLIPNGVDGERFRSRPAPNRWFLDRYRVRDFVLQVGTISPVKNQLGLINALFDLPVPLVFIGHTPSGMNEYAKQCRERAQTRGNVIFIDHLAAEELPGIYALAAVHALPSWRETPGLVSLEAAACGCRIVSTSIGSAPEYFGELAYYCHPASTESIRNAVEAALRAPVEPALRTKVLDRFTWRRAGEATLASYQHAMGTH